MEALLTLLGVLIGAAISWFQTYWFSRRVKLIVRPSNCYITGSGPARHRFGIEVVNLSSFPVTVCEVGFVRKICPCRKEYMVAADVEVLDEKPWPRRLESRSSVVAYFKPSEFRGAPHVTVEAAYVKTTCDEIRTGTSPALSEINRYILEVGAK